MPLYEYRCTACGYSFEKIQSFSAKPETECPKCQGVLIRPVTAPALRFAGAGWYVNDYAGKGTAKPAEATASASDAPKSTVANAAESSASTPVASAPATPAANSSAGSSTSNSTT